MTETQQRFLRAIAERVPMRQVVELHLFPPIRQGGVETGVAVVAEDPRPPLPDAEAGGVPIVAEESAVEDESPYAEEEAVEASAESDGDASNGDAPAAPRSRYTIHTASYRLTLKGVDRGKWEVDVVAEADAPLDAVDAVVRGVQRRSGEGAEPDRLNAEAFRGALEAPLATLER